MSHLESSKETGTGTEKNKELRIALSKEQEQKEIMINFSIKEIIANVNTLILSTNNKEIDIINIYDNWSIHHWKYVKIKNLIEKVSNGMNEMEFNTFLDILKENLWDSVTDIRIDAATSTWNKPYPINPYTEIKITIDRNISTFNDFAQDTLWNNTTTWRNS